MKPRLSFERLELSRLCANKSNYFLDRLSGFEFRRPGTSRMNDVPAGTPHITAAAPGIMIAEAVNYGIPHWLEMIDEKSFR